MNSTLNPLQIVSDATIQEIPQLITSLNIKRIRFEYTLGLSETI